MYPPAVPMTLGVSISKEAGRESSPLIGVVSYSVVPMDSLCGLLLDGGSVVLMEWMLGERDRGGFLLLVSGTERRREFSCLRFSLGGVESGCVDSIAGGAEASGRTKWRG